MIGSTPRVDSIEAVEANLAGSSAVGIRQFSGIGFCDGPWPKTARQYRADGSFEDVTVTLETALAVTEQAVRELRGKYPRAAAIPAPGTHGKAASLYRRRKHLPEQRDGKNRQKI